MKPFTTTFIFPIGETLGGANIWSARMCGHLDRLGEPTSAILHANPGWHPDNDLPLPVATRRLDCGAPPVTEAGQRHVKQFAQVYEATLPSIIVPNWSDVSYATCAELSKTRASDMRVIGVAHGNNDSYYETLSRYETVITVFIAVSEEIEHQLKKRLPHRAADIYTRSCPVDVPDILDKPESDSTKPLVITYVGRLTNHEKKVSNLAPLMTELGKRGVDYRFRIIGEGGYRKTLEHEISCLPENLQHRVVIEGVILPSLMGDVWRETDVCVLVSDSEGTSISMLESMAAGCVPVVTRVSGVNAVIDEAVNGFVVERDNMATMADRIAKLAGNRELLRTMGTAAYQTAKARYSYEQYIPWFQELMAASWNKPAGTWPEKMRLLPPGPGPHINVWKKSKEAMSSFVMRLMKRIKRYLK